MAQHNAPTKPSSLSPKIEKVLNVEKKEDTSSVIPKKEELSSKIVTFSCKQKGMVSKAEQDDIIDQLSKNLYDIDLNKPSPLKIVL